MRCWLPPYRELQSASPRRYSSNSRGVPACWLCNAASLDHSHRRSRASTSPCGISMPGGARSRCGSCSAAPAEQIKVYASGINPTGSRQMAEAALARGHRALKLKIGFEPASDRANLASLRDLLGNGMLAADANQGWSIEQALELAPGLSEFNLAWLEEPIRADRPWQEWQALRKGAAVPLAAGENIASRDGFKQALGDDVLRVVQPDIAKWGGLTECSAIARDIVEIRQDVLSALSRRRDRSAGVSASARRGRGRRPAGGRFQRQPAA